jgi:WD40 repeat protein
VATAPPVPNEQFYVVGGNLHPDAPSYVRRQADDDLYDALGRGEFCYILTSRQMGKSSLIVRTATRLAQDGVRVVTIDLTGIGQNLTADQWYSGLLLNIGERLDLEDELDDFWDEHEQLSPVQRFVEALRRVVLPAIEGRVILFLDEIDVAQSLPFSANEFFAAIRHCYTRRTEDPEFERLTFCLAGVATPSDLIDDPLTTPFNIGTRIELSDFAEDEAARLAEGLGRDDAVAATLVSRVLHWTNGHPYLTQRMCAAAQADTDIETSEDVDRLCEELFFSESARDQEPNLQFVRNQMLWRDLDHAALLNLYADVVRGKTVANEETNPLINVLRLAGIVRVDRGRLVARNGIYDRVFDRAWIRENMPDAEVRRQRAAYRRGVIRTAAAAAAVLAVVLTLAVVAVTQSGRASRSAEGALVLAATTQMERGMQLLESGDANGLLELVAANDTAPASSRAKASTRRLWAGWRAAYKGRLLRVWDSHDATQTAVSHDLTLAAEASREGVVRVQEMASGVDIVGPLDHGRTVWGMRLSPDNSLIAVSSPDSTHIWRLSSRELVTPHIPRGGFVAFSHDGTQVAVAYDQLEIWDLTTTRQVAGPVPVPLGVFALAFSPDGSLIATGGEDTHVRLWDAATLNELTPAIPQKAIVQAVQFSPDGQLLLTGTTDGRARLWDVASRTQVGRTLIHLDSVYKAVWSVDGATLATATHDRATVWDVATSQPRGMPFTHGGQLTALEFGDDGAHLATCSGFGVRVWALPDRDTHGFDTRHTQPVGDVDVSPDGRLLATGGWDNAVHVLRLDTHELAYPPLMCADQVQRVAFSPDSRVLASGDNSGAVRLWDAQTGSALDRSLTHDGVVWDVEFSPDGSLIASGGQDDVAKIWDLESGAEVVSPLRHNSRVHGVSFSADGSQLATASMDATVSIWSVATGERIGAPLLMPIGVTTVEFSPDSTRLAVATHDDYIRFWDVALRVQVGPKIRHPFVWELEYSASGNVIAAASVAAAEAQLWDVETGLRYGAAFPHARAVAGLAFAPDMSWLATVCDDGATRIWPVPQPVDDDADLAVISKVDLGLYRDRSGSTQPVPAAEWNTIRGADDTSRH